MLRVHRHPRHPGAASPERVADAWVLDAEATWVVEGPPEEIDDVVADLGGGVCERVAAGVVLLRFGNAVGRVNRAGSLGALTVHSGKWTAKDYDQLLEDLSRVTAALPFSTSSPSSLPYERDALNTRNVLYHAFVWLRHSLLSDHTHDLHDAICGILRDPHRRLVRTSRVVPVELAGRVGGRSLDDVASGRWPIVDHPLGFVVGGRRVLPVQVMEDRSQESVDTAENRFVRAFLEECLWVVEQSRRHLGHDESHLARRVRQDCERLNKLLVGWRRAAMWGEVGVMTHFPASSSVLQRRHEYRTVLRHHMMLRLGSRVPLDPQTVSRLLESKDIATLYELWATFTVLHEVTQLLGRPTSSAHVVTNPKGATVSWGLVAQWPNGIKLAYNPTYTRTSGFHGLSRSLQVRPDIALFVPAGLNAGLHLLDAKFRLDGLLNPEADDDGTSFKSSDLHKMHAYRDAIPEARSAWVVYPGAENTAYFDDGRLGLAAADVGFVKGVGALSLRPGGGRAGLTAVLRAMLLSPT
ncbi:MAG: DUF2357 domain-containing protein [Deltaproteobacteria bacterium]|nr:DUF2357 domain-containing protein [Deltaproteobacteria bacterium]